MYRMEDLAKQATTTTGTGDLTFGAALDGFLTFSSQLDDLDYITYEVHAVDAAGARTGQFETGIGQFWLDGATPKLRRARPLTNSAGTAPAPLSFSAGTKQVYITVTGAQARALKIYDAGYGEPVTLYVRADGDDANSGFEDSSAGAFATPQRAADVAAACFSTATIVIGAGAFGDLSISTPPPAVCRLTVIGAGRASTTIGGVFIGEGVNAGVFDALIANADGRGVTVSGHGASCFIGENADPAKTLAFGACADGHLLVKNGASVALMDYHIAGGCAAGPHIELNGAARATASGEQTVDANVTIAGGWVKGRGPGFIDFINNTFTLGGHTVTGSRYDLQGNCVCDTHGAGASYLPGSTSGSSAAGGQYL